MIDKVKSPAEKIGVNLVERLIATAFTGESTERDTVRHLLNLNVQRDGILFKATVDKYGDQDYAASYELDALAQKLNCAVVDTGLAFRPTSGEELNKLLDQTIAAERRPRAGIIDRASGRGGYGFGDR